LGKKESCREVSLNITLGNISNVDKLGGVGGQAEGGKVGVLHEKLQYDTFEAKYLHGDWGRGTKLVEIVVNLLNTKNQHKRVRM
jgi:hypothetical protein